MEKEAITLPDGRRVPGRAGRYVVLPPPDLNATQEGDEEYFLLEYAAPDLIVRDRALPSASPMEFQNLVYQTWLWQNANRHIRGTVGGSRSGYAFADGDSSSTQFWIPGCSYVDDTTWAILDADARNMLYLPCVPTVTIELVTDVDSMEDLQAKVARYIAAGTREAVVVDTQEDRVWIHNQGSTPYFASPLATIEFGSWPGFRLDCVALRAAGQSVFA